ncbi:Mitochondrial acyl carrier protein 1 [Hibiscus syriacus]|uniref:Mitochondrial acyl carrier protein 1 n=1 Tax=Hibiscus syriacus TaxID=106335 RepID=A0A6A3AGB3_HIBSY|nr:putative invertase inhibitor [Hibiscus syriacus]KAE8702777.1 Mitochondrial acyl carrier protein 1 [Hibiscus syriacus]
MRIRSSSSFGIPLIISLLFISTLSSYCLTPTASNLIRTTCKKITDGSPNLSYDFCVNSLQAAPNSHSAKDLRQLGDISFVLLRRNLTDSRSYIEQLLKHKKMETPMRIRVQGCVQIYSLAIFSAEEAFQHYNAKRYRDANTHVSAASTYVTTCEDGFSEIPGLVSPLTDINNVTSQLCDISNSIVTMFFD